MMPVDELVRLVKRTAADGDPNEGIRVRRSYLGLLVNEIEALRKALGDSIPDDNREGSRRRNAMDTEHKAALAVYPRSGSQRLRVLIAIADSYERGLNDGEIVDITGIAVQSVNPRRRELLYGGWVADSGRRRPTGSGGEGAVWVATEKTFIALREKGVHA